MTLIFNDFNVFIASEPGGAEVLASIAEAQNTELHYILEGPAIEIFKRRLGSIKIESLSILETLKDKEIGVLTSTSLTSNLERDAIKECRKNNIYCAAFIDHWINYDLRFERDINREFILPNKILVGDNYAYNRCIEAGFPSEIIQIEENPQIITVVNRIKKLSENNTHSILILAEPLTELSEKIYGIKDGFGITEEEIIYQILESIINSDKFSKISEIRIRNHPKEKREKYVKICKSFKSEKIKISDEPDFIVDIAESSTVIGIESIGLFYAAKANKKAISFIPTDRFSCRLPHKEIIITKHKNELIKNI